MTLTSTITLSLVLLSVISQNSLMARDKVDAARPGSDAISRKAYRARLHSGTISTNSGGKDHRRFLETVIPVAKEVESRTGHDWRLIVGQAAVETDWGRKVKGNSFWGVKAQEGYEGKTTNIDTHEMLGGKRKDVTDKFRAYENIGEAADGYIQFLQENPRYEHYLAAAKKKDLQEALRQLDESGYATDLVEEGKGKDWDPKTYGEKVGGVIMGRTFRNITKGKKYEDKDWYHFDRYSSERYNALLSERKSRLAGKT